MRVGKGDRPPRLMARACAALERQAGRRPAEINWIKRKFTECADHSDHRIGHWELAIGRRFLAGRSTGVVAGDVTRC